MPKVAKPGTYDGKKRGKAAKQFMMECGAYVILSGAHFPSPSAFILFIIGYLTDSAKLWAFPIQEGILRGSQAPVCTDVDVFGAAFEEAFGVVDEEDRAIKEIEKLRQTRSAADYTAEFRRIACDIHCWTNESFIRQYKKGLKSDVLDILAHEADPPYAHRPHGEDHSA